MPTFIAALLWIAIGLIAFVYVACMFVKFHKKQKASYQQMQGELSLEFMRRKMELDKDKYDCEIIDRDGNRKTVELKGPSAEDVIRQVEQDLGGKIVSIRKRIP